MSTPTSAVGPELVHAAISAQACARADAIAVIAGARSMTYGTLERASDTVAAELQRRGVKPGHVVPVLFDRSLELVAALLGVLKAGAAYAALDPGWPLPRIDMILKAAGARLVLTARTDITGAWCPDPLDVDALAVAGSTPCKVDLAGDAPCAVFFTSGTTGAPKGAVSPHRGTTRLFLPCSFADFNPGTVMPQAAPLPWDGLTLELWSVLLVGGTSVLVPLAHLLPSTLRELIRGGVNTAWLTSSLFNMFVDEDVDAFRGLCQLLIGGERLSPGHVRRFLLAHPDTLLVNGYGPAEATVFATTHPVRLEDCSNPDGIPIGTPVAGTETYVVDGDRECGQGERGEICIAGDGLAVEYLGDRALTAQKFVHMAVGGGAKRVYHSGDIGFWRDGLLYYAGRSDRQVKVRGHRVEPAEVERAIASLPGVNSCAALTVDGGSGYETKLVAFYTTSDRQPLATSVVDQIGEQIPSYLRPQAVVHTERLPLTTTGKLDRSSLLAQLGPAVRPTPAPSQPAAVDMAVAFRDVLGLAHVPEDDASFFELGGSSLDASRLCVRLSLATGITVSVAQVARTPTARSLERWLTGQQVQSCPHVDPRRVPLTSMQAGFCLAELLDPDDLSALCPLAWLITGTLDADALTAAIRDVHWRHEALRARYRLNGEQILLISDDVDPPRLECLPAKPGLEEARITLLGALARPLRPSRGEVWRACLVPSVNPPRCLLGLVVHHAAMDGHSESVLASDLSLAYTARLRGAAPAFAEPAAAAADIYTAHWQEMTRGGAGEGHLYWRRLAGLPTLRLPFPQVPRPRGCGAVDLELPAALLARWDALARRCAGTRFSAMLGTYATAIARVTGQRDFAIGVPVAKRSHPAVDRAVTCLIDTVCIRLQPDPAARPAEFVAATSRAVRGALAAQELPFASVVRLLKPRRNDRHPLYQAMFAFQDNRWPRLDFPGCSASFFRPDPPHAVAELLAEAQLTSGGALSWHITYRPDRVSEEFVTEVATVTQQILHLEDIS